MKGTLFRNSVSQIHAQRRVLRVEHTFMVPEYGPTFQRNAITSFPASNAIVDPNFESRNLIRLTRDWTTCDF